MSASASLSLSKHQITNVKQAITDLKSENTEYMNTMKRLIDSTQDIHRDNQKLEQGIELQRNYLLRLREKVSKVPKLVEKSRSLNIQATHRMKKYQRQISKQTRGVSVLKIRDEIERLLNDITKIKQKTNKYKQKVDEEHLAIEEIIKLNELKRDLVKMNQRLTDEAQKLIINVSKLKMPSEIEKHVNELKQKMLKSDEIRKKLEAEDPDFQKSNSDIFAQVDERLKQAVPIFDDLESLFLSSSSSMLTMKQSSDTISIICSDLAQSEASRMSQKSSARTENDPLSSKMAKNNLDSSSSLSLNEQKSKKTNSVFAKTAGNLLNMSKEEIQKFNDDYKKAESEIPIRLKNKRSSSIRKSKSNACSENEKSDSDSENLNSKSKKYKSSKLLTSEIENSEDVNNKNKSMESKKKNDKNNSKIEDSDSEQENSKSPKIKQKSKQNSEQENEDSESENDKDKSIKSKSKQKSDKSKSNNDNSDSEQENSKSQKIKQKSKQNSEQENEDSEPENDKDKSIKSKSKQKSDKTKSNNDNDNSEQENEDSESENDKGKSMKSKSKQKSDISKSNNDNDNSEQENEDSESENDKDKSMKSKSKQKSDKTKSNNDNSDSEQDNSKSQKIKQKSKQNSEQENDESESENINDKNKDSKSKSKSLKTKSENEEPKSKSDKIKSKSQKQSSDPENEDLEPESESKTNGNKKPKSRIKKSKSKNEDNSDSENQIESDSEPQFSKSLNSSLRRDKSKSDDQESDQESEKQKSKQQQLKEPESESQENPNKKHRIRIKRPVFSQGINSDQNENNSQSKKSKSEDEASKPKRKKYRKLSSSNKIDDLSSKSADESFYPTSSSQETFLSDSKQNKDESFSLSEQSKNSPKPKRIKKRRTSKQNPDLSRTMSEIKKDNNNDDDDDIMNINSKSNNLLAKTQPQINILLSKGKNESESNQNANTIGRRRKRKRKSGMMVNNSLSEYSSSILPASSSNKKDIKDAKNDSDYSDSLTFEKDETGTSKSIKTKNNKNNDKNKNTSKSLNNSLQILKPIVDNLLPTDKNEKEDDIVLKKRKTNKPNSKQTKKEIDSESDNYEPFSSVNNKEENKTKKHKRKHKQKDTDKSPNSNDKNENDEDNNFIKSGINKLINTASLNKDNENNSAASTETYNDNFETDIESSAFQQNKENNKVSIYDFDGNKILGSIFVNSKGVPLSNTKVFDKDGNEINRELKFNENGQIEESKDIFDEFRNKINSIIKVDDKGEPTNKKIFDSKGNEIKDATKIKLDNNNNNNNNKKKKKENQENDKKSQNKIETEIIEEEEEGSEPEKSTENQEIYDKKHNKIENPVLIDSKSGKPINAKLFDSNDQQINDPIETHSNGKPKTKVFDSNGNQINCLISVDENGVPIKPEVFDENGNKIKSLKSFIDKNKKKIKKKKNHRLFDKDENEIKNILIIDNLGKPLNIQVFDSDGEEVKSSITFTKNLFDSNKVKVDSIVEIDSSGRPTNSRIFDSKGNEFSDLSFLIPKEKTQIESSASFSENEDEEVFHRPKKKKTISVTIDENRRPINTTLFDSDGNELSIVEFDSYGNPTKHIYNKNKKKVTEIIIKDQDEYEEDVDSISSLSSDSESSNLDEQFRRSKSEIDNIFCDANGNEFKNPIFVDLNNIPYNNVQVYDSQCHLLNSPLKYDPKTGAPQDQIFDFQGLPFSHVVQIGTDGNPTNFTLYNIQMEPVTFPTLKIHRPKREKLQMVDDKANSNLISFENPDKEEEDQKEKKPKKSSQTKWTRSILSNVISSQLDKTKLSVAVADANVMLIHLEEDIHNLEDEKVFLERKVNSQIELRDKVEKTKNMNLVFDVFDFFIEPTPTPDRSEYYHDILVQSEMTGEDLIKVMNEIDSNSKFLADNIVFEQQKITADSHFPELEKIYFKLMNKNSKLKHVIDKLESHLNIVTSDSMAEYASKETRMRVRFEDSKKEKISTMSQTESSISEGSIQINDLNNRIEDQKMLIEMLKKQIAEQQRKDRPDAKKLCLELDGLRGIDKKNRENLKMLELEQNSIETQASKIWELIDEKSMSNLQQSIDDYQRQLNDLKDSFARMRKKGVKKANPLTNKYELMGLEEKIKEAKKQIADVKRKDSVAVNKIDKRVKILLSYGLRVPSYKRVSNGECI